ncbi:hypothetical protein DFH09DRAFT_1103512 [Mycena vulgaris]|nr:hypothetical protein DFH09DRAFT_1103512 [Mycena vulgaris]
MVQDDPAKRLTIDEVVARFDEIRAGLSSWKLRSRVVKKSDFRFNIPRILSHWFRRVGYIDNSYGIIDCGTPAITFPATSAQKAKVGSDVQGNNKSSKCPPNAPDSPPTSAFIKVESNRLTTVSHYRKSHDLYRGMLDEGDIQYPPSATPGGEEGMCIWLWDRWGETGLDGPKRWVCVCVGTERVNGTGRERSGARGMDRKDVHVYRLEQIKSQHLQLGCRGERGVPKLDESGRMEM